MKRTLSVSQRGQSLLELALTLPMVLLLLAGLVEVGFFINEYIDVIDATREAARFGTNLVYTDTFTYDNPADDSGPDDDGDGFVDGDQGYCTGSNDPQQTTHFYYVVACLARDNLSRVEGLNLELKGAHKGVACADCADDIVISLFSFDRSSPTALVRIPDSDGWSFTLANGGAGCRALDINNDSVVDSLDYCPSTIDASFVSSRLVSTAPNAGLVLVEVFYHHYQVLNLPFFNLIANPMRVHAYSFFPNPSAEPSATP
jgi:hypothetical protein